MSGSGARSIFYVGFMEVLEENKIPIYAISAQSGASIVATAYATGTLKALKSELLSLNWKTAKKFFSPSKNGLGLLSLSNAEKYIREKYTFGKTFEDLKTKLCFPATELSSGELVPLAYGDLAKAIVTTCSVPGLFDPVKWGNKLLLDGGILSTIPSKVVKDFGVEKVISVSIRSTNHVFPAYQLKIKEKINKLKKQLTWSREPKNLAFAHGHFGQGAIPDSKDFLGNMTYTQLLGQALDLALEASKSGSLELEKSYCDLAITEGEGDFGDSFSIKKGQKLYNLGREVGLKYLPKIKAIVYE